MIEFPVKKETIGKIKSPSQKKKELDKLTSWKQKKQKENIYERYFPKDTSASHGDVNQQPQPCCCNRSSHVLLSSCQQNSCHRQQNLGCPLSSDGIIKDIALTVEALRDDVKNLKVCLNIQNEVSIPQMIRDALMKSQNIFPDTQPSNHAGPPTSVSAATGSTSSVCATTCSPSLTGSTAGTSTRADTTTTSSASTITSPAGTSSSSAGAPTSSASTTSTTTSSPCAQPLSSSNLSSNDSHTSIDDAIHDMSCDLN